MADLAPHRILVVCGRYVCRRDRCSSTSAKIGCGRTLLDATNLRPMDTGRASYLMKPAYLTIMITRILNLAANDS
jgi:hypothetical protein